MRFKKDFQMKDTKVICLFIINKNKYTKKKGIADLQLLYKSFVDF